MLCCQCGGNNTDSSCYDTNTQCSFGCSPFIDNNTIPASWNSDLSSYMDRTCPNNGLISSNGDNDINMPNWPLLDGINPAYIYKSTSPNAYTWQFNDFQSTFKCRNADYKITYCHHKNPNPISMFFIHSH